MPLVEFLGYLSHLCGLCIGNQTVVILSVVVLCVASGCGLWLSMRRRCLRRPKPESAIVPVRAVELADPNQPQSSNMDLTIDTPEGYRVCVRVSGRLSMHR